jgi:demethylmenaquinone methyltransferase/2-methoxy-6-polyprenyl-1,4-benzoquinol methylase
LLAGSSEKTFIKLGLKKLGFTPGEKALEIGFGTGYAILSMANSVGKNGKIYGIDISEGMYTLTKQRIEKAGLEDLVELKTGDATRLPFEAGFFDAVFISFTLELFDTPDIHTVLQECKRVLKNNGRICIMAMAQKEKPGFAIRLYEWAHKRFPVAVDCRPIYTKEALVEAGFQIIDELEKSMWGLPVDIILAKGSN